jgi:XTP/dITP diphosphohydrolase
MSLPPTILIATTNHGKLREIRAALAGVAVDFIDLSRFPELAPPPEDGARFEDNARIKALYYVARTGLWTLADDSGLEVDALDGDPGVRSARFAGPQATDRDNNARVVERLRGVSEERRAARFRCAMVLAAPAHAVGEQPRALAEAGGVVEGRIIDEPRGSNGFGYDPHFFLPGRALTIAQLTPEEKNRISHRGLALANLRPALERLLREWAAG